MLEEAACELFLEQGYAATSVADITRRAGVSRATFFNYVPAKSDLLWTSVDDALTRLEDHLRDMPAGGTGRDAAVADPRAALHAVAAEFEPGSVVLAFANAEPMGVVEELEESAARRQSRAGRIIAQHLGRRGVDDLTADVLGTALAGAFLSALRHWSRLPVPRAPFARVLADALDVLAPAAPAARGGTHGAG